MASRTLALWRYWKAPLQSGCIALAGDVTCQCGMTGTPLTELDLRRSASFFIFGAGYGGVFQRYLYGIFDRMYGHGTGMRTVMSKVLTDAFVTAPIIYCPSFYFTTSLVQGKSFAQARSALEGKWLPTMKAYLSIWPAFVGICFKFVPVSGRVVFIAGVGFVEKSILSAISNDVFPFNPGGPLGAAAAPKQASPAACAAGEAGR